MDTLFEKYNSIVGNTCSHIFIYIDSFLQINPITIQDKPGHWIRKNDICVQFTQEELLQHKNLYSDKRGKNGIPHHQDTLSVAK